MAVHYLTNSLDGVIYKNIRSLRDEQKYFDVTLVSDDGEIFSAHKLILASQSEKLNKILSQMTMSSTNSQTIYLIGISGCELSDILDFMYVGHVKISQEKLMNFLKAAQLLCVNSLSDINAKDESLPSKDTMDDETILGYNDELEEISKLQIEKLESSELGQEQDLEDESWELAKEKKSAKRDFVSGSPSNNGYTTSLKKARLAFSSVHDEFKPIKIPDLKTGSTKDGRVCKLCEFVFEHKITSTLKTHLKLKHPSVYCQVTAKDEAMLAKKLSQGSMQQSIQFSENVLLGESGDRGSNS